MAVQRFDGSENDVAAQTAPDSDASLIRQVEPARIRRLVNGVPDASQAPRLQGNLDVRRRELARMRRYAEPQLVASCAIR